MSKTITFSEDLQWSLLKKLSFRFFFILLLLFIIVNNNGAFPFFEIITNYPTQLLHQFIPWVADHILNYKYDHTIFTNGSGDTSYDYVLLATITITSLVGMAIWSVIDFKRRNYSTLYYWLLVLVRCYLAFTLLNYGMYKIIKLQFPFPSLGRLVQPYGESSPMGLAWTFLGFSKGYNIFMGIIEVSSVLVLFRRTMVIGAFLSLAASAHVMSMNYFYDVPVKILSTALVVMCLFILAPYLKRTLYFFLSNNSVTLRIIEAPAYRKKWMYYSIYTFKYLMIAFIVISTVINLSASAKQYGDAAPKPPLYGIYKTENFRLNSTEQVPLITDTLQWRQLVIQWEGYAQIKTANDSVKTASFKVDTLKKQIKFYFYKDTINKSVLNYRLEGKDKVNIYGQLNKDSIDIMLKKIDLKKFRLNSQGFRWVNEFPYNR